MKVKEIERFKHYTCTIDKVVLGDNGHFISINGTFNDTPLTLLNYYAPTSDKQDEQLFELDKILPHINRALYGNNLGGRYEYGLTARHGQVWT